MRFGRSKPRGIESMRGKWPLSVTRSQATAEVYCVIAQARSCSGAQCDEKLSIAAVVAVVVWLSVLGMWKTLSLTSRFFPSEKKFAPRPTTVLSFTLARKSCSLAYLRNLVEVFISIQFDFCFFLLSLSLGVPGCMMINHSGVSWLTDISKPVSIRGFPR